MGTEKPEQNGDFTKGCLIFFAAILGLTILSMAFGFIFGGENYAHDFLNEDSDGTNLGTLRTVFVITIIIGVIFVYQRYIKKDK